MTSKARPTDQWKSQIGVILAVAGSAVGLGNFLRFPGQAVTHGGGAFMIPYFCALLLLGIPIGWSEWAMGRYGGERGLHSVPGILGMVGHGRVPRYFGVLGLLIPLVIYMYYGLIEAWCLRYAWAYLAGGPALGTDPAGWAAASADLFARVTGSNQDGLLLHGGLDPTVVCLFLVLAMNLWLVWRGLSGGIELFCQIAMPAMAICAVFVLIRVLTLGTPNPAEPHQNVLAGLAYMWNPDFSQLGNFDTWLAAGGQVFFSLSVGFGVILNYASYISRKDDIVLSSLTAASTNELFEVSFGGLITVTAAFVFLGANGVAGGTFGVGFQTLPVVFASMGSIGRWVGAAWFLTLFLAAITSSLSMLQPVKAFLEESLGLHRGVAVVLLGGIAVSGSIWVAWFSKGLRALDTMDFWVGTVAIFVLATVQIILFGWVLGVDKGLESAHEGAEIRIPGIFRYILKYVAPVYLGVVLIGFCIQNLPDRLATVAAEPVARSTIGLVGAVLALLAVLTWFGEKRWREQGIDIDGRDKQPEVAR